MACYSKPSWLFSWLLGGPSFHCFSVTAVQTSDTQPRLLLLLMTARSAPLMGKRVVVLAGPTAVGKSSLAMRLCEHLNGELISVDSVQVYRGLQIGANKPSAAERARVYFGPGRGAG